MGGSFLELQAVDAVCYYRGVTIAVEIKSGPKELVGMSQLLTLAGWRGNSVIVTGLDELMMAMQDPIEYCLSRQDKTNILNYCPMWKTKSKAKNPQMALHRVYSEILQREK